MRGDELEMFVERLGVSMSLGLDLMELSVDSIEGFVKGANEGVDGRFPFGQFLNLVSLQGPEPLACESEKTFIAVIEGLGGERLELIPHAPTEASVEGGCNEGAQKDSNE